jgi:hypothetical protein
MMYRFIPVALLFAGVAAAQVPGAAAKRAAQNAADAANAQLSQQTGQAVPAPKGAAPTVSKSAAPTTQAPAASSKPAAPPQGTPQKPATPASPNAATVQQSGAPNAPNASAAAPNAAAPATPGKAPASSAKAKDSLKAKDSVLVMREAFDYTRDGRRDPFVSLMTTSDLRPVLSDLRLTGVLYDLSQRRHVAIMRDESTPGGAQWRVTTGMTLGRMRVSAIRPKVVVFTIEEFGFSRQDSLILGDSTRVRSK